MAAYTENDVQNIFADLRNRGALATASTYYGVPRTTLRGHLNNTPSYRNIYDNK